ncbi:prolipoprotein diacylglyceryl transferase [Haloferula sp. A504]|uniref:prolipoprotein diacylglyceryl transferase n=1 Tax=Haloferula sp. A504 TaxID=3373601 RepID=UPI0031C79A16|nr:prolipoprotein diacylglyceryl transferase [Verrucomicrobiaceae bacterium E54]
MTPGSPIYAAAVAAGILIGALGWWRMSRNDPRLPVIYFCGLIGAFLGAKLAFLAAEGWLHAGDPDRWTIWLSGKSVMGALPGGWAAVEAAKHFTGYDQVTGDRFALLLPIPLVLGRLGCLHAGCCLGIPLDCCRWPAVPVEIGFQLVVFAGLLALRWRQILPGQHFHLYLIAYGLFRFSHEFLRATPKPFAGLSGYQLLALGTAGAAILAFVRRANDASGEGKNSPDSGGCETPGSRQV